MHHALLPSTAVAASVAIAFVVGAVSAMTVCGGSCYQHV